MKCTLTGAWQTLAWPKENFHCVSWNVHFSSAAPQIGFDPTSYTVNEADGVATLTITTSDPGSFTDATGTLFYTEDLSAAGSGGLYNIIQPMIESCLISGQ